MGVDTINIIPRSRDVMVVNKRELEIGTRVEKKEHGFNLTISRKIAMDHIKEFPKYYTHKTYGLIALEKKLKKMKG